MICCDFELRVAERLRRADHAVGRGDGALDAQEAPGRALVRGVRRVLDFHQVGHHRARVERVVRRRLGDRGRAAGSSQIVRRDHRVAHAAEAVGVVDAADVEQAEALRRECRVDAGRRRCDRLGSRLQRDRADVHEAGRRRGDDEEGLLRRVEHVDREGRRHFLLQRVGGDGGGEARAVVEPGDVGRGERRARHDDSVALDLARLERDQEAVGAVPQGIRRCQPTMHREAVGDHRDRRRFGLAAGGRNGRIRPACSVRSSAPRRCRAGRRRRLRSLPIRSRRSLRACRSGPCPGDARSSRRGCARRTARTCWCRRA